ncbi:acyl-CoA synthetase [Sneathiella aquimaris]|uniref:acyl-CoA synthetase n=1 Tax=Sneathiella aquimaris TaxID=2599305 RepID=UPI00146D78C0|nr:long-chain fatty acid--CoA ligase [Sneathiella aquimaris]
MGSVRVFDWLEHHANFRGTEKAVCDLESGRSYNWIEFNDRCSRLAGYLKHELSIKKGDRVGVLMANSTDFLEIQFACNKVGAVFLPLNWRLTVPELVFIAGDAAPEILICGSEFKEVADAVAAEVICVRHVIEADGAGGKTAYEDGISHNTPLASISDLTHDDLAAIMYTSGTTGLPKGAMITHGMTFWNAINLGMPHRISPDTVHLSVLPLFHTGGLNCYTNPVIHAGGTVYIMRNFDPVECLRIIGDPEYGLTHFFGVPANYQFMAQQPEFQKTDFSRIKTAGIGGAPVPVPLLETYHARGLSIAQGFGMTETSPTVLGLDTSEAMAKPGSTGKPVLHNEVRIVNENGEDVVPGEMGELWVRGPNITPGYWNRPDATAETITDGWLHTGDACRMDEDGFYYILDRTKDMYISGGENVYPAEVENILYQLDEVVEAAVIGLPDDKWGETGCAVLVLKAGATTTENEVLTHCRSQLASFKIPKNVTFVKALPRNATGKILKRTLREQFEKGSKIQ